ncbi:hypothetical protein EDF24_3729 [Curtobacterium sp. PhB130]|uniref:hypothetical protein n=1 Tax=unclassified Curtobacterium TaxID=257496 RepID=UPI000F4B480C|nr:MULTISPECIES: hypothetical protein [unclassified Curtobacterium]ROS71871.1 hypothetical protein EDF24_3729 [Curtobacterium sp. PhB130]TCK58260.1 hypothetical protein EDF27_3871 [Curtobacterium sp. PhB136]
MTKRYESLQTVVPHDNTLSTDYSRTRKLAQRLEDLNSWANRGYELRHTHVFTHDDSEIYIDDLDKDLDDPR